MARILIIDDNETMREGLGATVRRMGHEAVLASSGAEGLTHARARERGRRRLRDHRPQDGGRPAAWTCVKAVARARSRLPGDDRDRLRHRRDRGRGDAARRLRLPAEAVRARGGAPQGRARAGAARRAPRARARRGRERRAARRRRRAVPLRRDRRRDAGDARACSQTDREGRADRRVGLHPRRVGTGKELVARAIHARSQARAAGRSSRSTAAR